VDKEARRKEGSVNKRDSAALALFAPGRRRPSHYPARAVTAPAPLFGVPETSEPIRLTLPYPPSANRYWRTRVAGGGKKAFVQTYPSEDAKAFKQAVAAICAAAQVRPLVGDVTLAIDLYRPQRTGDVSNRVKVLEDALIGFAFADDAQVRAVDIQRDDDKHTPRAEVEVRPWTRRPPLPPTQAVAQAGSPEVCRGLIPGVSDCPDCNGSGDELMPCGPGDTVCEFCRGSGKYTPGGAA
jgi:crossover junction endodeoxyribonuclease RusA